MTNPNPNPNRSRSRGDQVHHPSPDELRAARLERGQTQAQAAASVMSTDRAWRKWEAGDRRMHPALWALYQRGGV